MIDIRGENRKQNDLFSLHGVQAPHYSILFVPRYNVDETDNLVVDG